MTLRSIAFCLVSIIAGVTPVAPLHASQPVMAIIIDDLGYRFDEGYKAVSLPGRVACAVIPNSPHGMAMAQAAHGNGKEVLLHLPMQSTDPERPVGDEGITIETTRDGVGRVLSQGLSRVPFAAGVNNHMGSLITRHPGHMTWLMQELRAQNLYFVDSMTTGNSVAFSMAIEQGVAAATRDVFIDRENASEQEIGAQLKHAMDLAQRQGHALVIGHPYPETMAVLERELHRFDKRGIRLVSVRELIEIRYREQRLARSETSKREPNEHTKDSGL